MSQVTITLNGRTYRVRCGAGEEPRLMQLADVVRAKLDGLVSEFGQAGDDRLLLMSALLIANELLDARARLSALQSRPIGAPIEAPQPEPEMPARSHGRTRPERAGAERVRPGNGSDPSNEPPPLPHTTRTGTV